MTVAYIIVAALVVVAIYFGVRYFVRARGEFGGSRVIICPELQPPGTAPRSQRRPGTASRSAARRR